MTIEELQGQIDEKWHALAKLVQRLAVGNRHEVMEALGALPTAAEEYAFVRMTNQRAIARIIDVCGTPNANLEAEARRKMRELLTHVAATYQPIPIDSLAKFCGPLPLPDGTDAERRRELKERLVKMAEPEEPITPTRIAAHIREAAEKEGLAVTIDMTADLIAVEIHGDCTARQVKAIGEAARQLAAPLVRVRLTWTGALVKGREVDR